MRVRFADEVTTSTNDNCLQLSQDETRSKSLIRPPPPYKPRFQQQPRNKDNSTPFEELTNTDCYANLLRAKSSLLAKSVENLALIPSYKMKQTAQIATSSLTSPKKAVGQNVNSNIAHRNVQM